MYQIEITTKYKILINKCIIIKIFILFPHKFKLSQNHIKMQEDTNNYKKYDLHVTNTCIHIIISETK